MSSAAATACTCTPRCPLNRTAASLNSALYSWTFFGPARGIDTSGLLGRSVYKSEGGFPDSFKRLLGGDTCLTQPPQQCVRRAPQRPLGVAAPPGTVGSGTSARRVQHCRTRLTLYAVSPRPRRS